MRSYEYKGYYPCGAGEQFIIDHFCESEVDCDDCRPTQEAVENGSLRFEARTPRHAVLIAKSNPELIIDMINPDIQVFDSIF